MDHYRHRKSSSWHIVFLLILVSGVNLLNMPAFRISGDSTAIEFASVRLINYGKLSVQREVASTYGDRGQFYFENTKKNKWYSKYGLANTIIFAIPRYLEKVFTGDLQYHSKHRILFLNFFNMLLSMLLFYYLYQLSTFYTSRLWITITFSLSVFYCTYLSYYLRAQSAELYQTLFFTGFYYYLVIVLRYNGYTRLKFTNFKLNLNLIVALVFLGLCCLSKIVYILIIPGFLFIIIIHSSKKQPYDKAQKTSDIISHIPVSLLFIASLILFIGFVNNYKFGSIFETGYGQFQNESKFSIGNIPQHFILSIIHPQNSLLINFPLIALSVFGIKAFINKYRKEALLIAVTIFPIYILVFSFGNWSGEFSYGPRYFLFALPVLALPAITYIEKFYQLRHLIIKYLLSTVLSLILIFSAFLNYNANALNFFISYDIRYSILDDIEDTFIKKYFENVHFGLIAYDLIKFRNDGKKLAFLKGINENLDSSEINVIETEILKKLDLNYYWLTNNFL